MMYPILLMTQEVYWKPMKLSLLTMTAEAGCICPLMESMYPDQRVKMLFFPKNSVLTYNTYI